MSSWDCKVKVADKLHETSRELNEISVNVAKDVCSKYQDLLVRTFQQAKGLVEAVLKYFRIKIHEGKFRVFGTIQTRTLDFDFPLKWLHYCGII